MIHTYIQPQALGFTAGNEWECSDEQVLSGVNADQLVQVFVLVCLCSRQDYSEWGSVFRDERIATSIWRFSSESVICGNHTWRFSSTKTTQFSILVNWPSNSEKKGSYIFLSTPCTSFSDFPKFSLSHWTNVRDDSDGILWWISQNLTG